MKKQKCLIQENINTSNPFDLLSEEIIFMILDYLKPNPFDQKSFSLVSKITDTYLSYISNSCGATLKSIDLSRSRFFTHVGLSCLASKCVGLVDIDVSNGVHLNDTAAAAIASCANLERLCLSRCKSLTDIGIGCIAVGCLKLKVLSLKWCLGVTDLGVALIGVKCKQIRTLDLSHLLVLNF
ncbi:Leucine-rich repeat, cysteine-containing subtype [Artemisia annua]|uniref:Leucine-rich repeat, cysteine-containing subtype n=1 Tax=Artemisia annua TaxID=35608 RepID=A0A2U1M6V6_ARTAN|nr:Leucine-rich repeat, cysteine-containing subtype [Artemisia annua]